MVSIATELNIANVQTAMVLTATGVFRREVSFPHANPAMSAIPRFDCQSLITVDDAAHGRNVTIIVLNRSSPLMTPVIIRNVTIIVRCF